MLNAEDFLRLKKELNIVSEGQILNSTISENENGMVIKNIEALVTTWGKRENANHGKLWYKPEGFKDFIQQMKDEGMSLPMYVNHQSMDVPIGKWTELKITDIGLVAKGEMFDTSKAKDVSTVMRDGSILRSVSITAYPNGLRLREHDFPN